MDPAFYALGLGARRRPRPARRPSSRKRIRRLETITYEFAAKGGRPAVKLLWYDGGKMPPRPGDLDANVQLGDNGIYFVGEKGTLLSGGWAAMPGIFPKTLRAAFQKPPKMIPRSPGHHEVWIQACKDRRPQDAKAGFAYSDPYTEALLVGLLAVRLQQRIEWDAAAMKARNAPAADALIHKHYRTGFTI